MGLVIRIYDIVSPNDFTVSIKKGDTAYPLDSGYYPCGDDVYSGGTEMITISGYTIPPGSKETLLLFDTQYWVKIVDTVTDRYIIENIKINNQAAFGDCDCTPPLIISLDCDLTSLDCELELTAEFVGFST